MILTLICMFNNDIFDNVSFTTNLPRFGQGFTTKFEVKLIVEVITRGLQLSNRILG